MKSTLSQRQWTIEIRGRTNTERDAILSHYNSMKGSLTPFNWIVPTFFGGNTFYVTYGDFSYSNPDGMGNIWNFQIMFVEELS